MSLLGRKISLRCKMDILENLGVCSPSSFKLNEGKKLSHQLHIWLVS